jgi:hypothetical protein
MPAVWVGFLGICTHFRLPLPAGPPGSGAIGAPTWRVVLMNLSDPQTIAGNPHLSHLGIVPHVAKLAIPVDHVAHIEGPASSSFTVSHGAYRLHLEGVKLRIVNSPATTLVEKGISCLPSLSLFRPGVGPGPALTTADPKLAACHFAEPVKACDSELVGCQSLPADVDFGALITPDAASTGCSNSGPPHLPST